MRDDEPPPHWSEQRFGWTRRRARSDAHATLLWIRAARTEDLHAFRAAIGDHQPQDALAIDAELRRRDAWAAPAGRAFWISIAALVISAGTLLLNVLGFI